MPRKSSPWDLTLSADKKADLALWLDREISNALAVRTASDAEVEYWHRLYEQGRTRSAASAPWADAADLTSPIGTEKVDALRSRIVKTLFVDPIWTVEGWGESAKNAPFVEEFHQWQAETSGFQSACARAIHLSLIEPRGALEVYEDTVRRPVRRTIRAKIQQADDGTALIGADLEPVLVRNADGSYVEVVETPETTPEQQGPSAEVVIDDYELVTNGPRERVIPYRDLLVLPGHAREQSDIWGYAKRFWRSVDRLNERADQGVYDRDAVTNLGNSDERHSAYSSAGATTLAGDALDLPTQEDGLAEKELWEITFLSELDATGYRWFVATFHQPTHTILRLQYDDIGRPRYCLFVPFPRPNSLEGYSFIGHKLITTIEENTAWRNMLADRASLQLQAPMMRQQNALWDPEDEPIGPKSIITVRDMNEVRAFQLPDYTAPARERIIDTERQAEKLGGMTDISSGSRPNENRTLGETRLVTSFSEVRIEEVVRNLQETLEEVAQIRHLMWQRTLSTMPEGLPVPQRVLQGLELRGVDVSTYLPNQRMAAQAMSGAFRFKPRGSVEGADTHQLRADLAEMLKALGALAQTNPMIGMVLAQPAPAKSLLEHILRIYAVPDRQAFLGPETMQGVQAQITAQAQMQQAQMAMQQQAAQMGGSVAPPGTRPGIPSTHPAAPPPGVM